MNTKLAVYTTVVLTYLLYGCDTWTLYRTQLKMFDQLHLKKDHGHILETAGSPTLTFSDFPKHPPSIHSS